MIIMFKCICGKEFSSGRGLGGHKSKCKLFLGEEVYQERCSKLSESKKDTTIIHKGNIEKRIKKELLDEYLADGWIFGLTDEHKQKDSKSVSGENNPMYGKEHSSETRKKISESLQGLLVGERNGMYGVDRSGETHCCYGRIKIYKDDTNSTCYPEEFPELEKQGWKRGVCQRTKMITSQHTKEGQLASPNMGSPDSKASWRTSYFRGYYLRSSYEAVFVAYHMFKNINFEISSESRILTKYNEDGSIYYNYHPDFYLPDTNTIVETNNGYKKDLLKLREEITLSYGYNWKLVLSDKIDEMYYEALNDGLNIDELWYKIQESSQGNRPHWDYKDGKIIFIESEEIVNE